MTTAAQAAEYRTNVGQDFTLADAYDAEYLDTPEEMDAEAGRRARQELNKRMAEWFGLFV